MQFQASPVRKSVANLLSTLADSGKIPHALLLKGKEGSGNLAAALAFAQYILCDNPKDKDSCGQCAHCKKVNSLSHPDLFFSFPFIKSEKEKHKATSTAFLEEWRQLLSETQVPSVRDWQKFLDAENKQLNIYTSEVRDITKRLSMKSYSGKKKILIMWLPEFMGKEGNVLLKLIEEPPANTIFLLVTEDETKILTTILSRTQRINIPGPSQVETEAYLTQINPLIYKEQAQTIAIISAGNINKALNIMGEVQEPYFEVFRTWLLHCYQRKYTAMIETVERLNKDGREACINFLNYGMEMIRKAFIVGNQAAQTELPEQEQVFVVKFAQLMAGRSFEDLYTVFNNAIYGLERNGNIKLLLTDTSIKLKDILTKK